MALLFKLETFSFYIKFCIVDSFFPTYSIPLHLPNYLLHMYLESVY